MGGERATYWGRRLRDYTEVANQETMVIPMMETVPAGDQIESILNVPGVDAIYFGPADYSSSAGFLGEWEGPGVAERLVEIKDRIRSKNVPCGIMATDVGNALERQRQGFQMVGIGSDTGLLIRSTLETLKAFDRAVPRT